MKNFNDNAKLAQSASALGAAILGFGIGAKWGGPVMEYATWGIVAGGIIHVYGMYLVQMKDRSSRPGITRALWISAWICLIALAVIVIMGIIKK